MVDEDEARLRESNLVVLVESDQTKSDQTKCSTKKKNFKLDKSCG